MIIMKEIMSFNSMDIKDREKFILDLNKSDLPVDKQIEFLKYAFNDSHDSVRIAAVRVVGKLAINTFYEDLVNLFQKDNQWLVRYYTLKTISSLYKEKASKIISKALQDKKPNIRILALELITLNNETAINNVIKLARDLDSRVSEKAYKMLESSSNTLAKQYIADYNKKLKEKEEKQKKMKDLFGDLI